MKIILAFDSFKDCLSSPEICQILAESIQLCAPECQIKSLPLGDGGEGTARAVTAACNGSMQHCIVHDPLFRDVEAQWGLLPDNSAVLEMASASGIELVAQHERNPMQTTTFGTGELLKYLACEKNIRHFIIGIGGSATVDCGIGMLQALGVKFYDENDFLLPCPASGADIARIRRIDDRELPPEIRCSTIKIASDVTNPLCGEYGAARVFAPQKGADAQMVEALEKNLYNFGTLSIRSNLADTMDAPGDGAAGGLGFALRNYLKAVSCSGAELVLDLLKFDRELQDADVVITGEGCSDYQTVHGKLCSVVSQHARRAGVPVILLSGALGGRAFELENCFDAVLALSSRPGTLQEALENTPENLRRMGKAIINLLNMKKM